MVDKKKAKAPDIEFEKVSDLVYTPLLNRHYMLAIVELMSGRMKSPANKYNLLHALAGQYHEIGDHRSARRLLIEASHQAAAVQGVAAMTCILSDAKEWGIRDMSDVKKRQDKLCTKRGATRKKSRAPKGGAEEYALIAITEALVKDLGKPGTLNLMKRLEPARYAIVSVEESYLLRLIKNRDPFSMKVTQQLKRWPLHRNRALNAHGLYYFKKGQWDKGLEYIRMIPSKDDRLRCLALYLMRLDPKTISPEFSHLWRFLKTELRLPIYISESTDNDFCGGGYSTTPVGSVGSGIKVSVCQRDLRMPIPVVRLFIRRGKKETIVDVSIEDEPKVLSSFVLPKGSWASLRELIQVNRNVLLAHWDCKRGYFGSDQVIEKMRANKANPYKSVGASYLRWMKGLKKV